MDASLNTGRKNAVGTLTLRGLLLLFVFAHAVFAGATHFHRVTQPGDAGHASARQESAEDSAAAKGHFQCVLCRLQRQLVSDGRPTGLRVVIPAADAATHEAYLSDTKSSPHPLLRQGRAPPLAS
ncbi:MAG TPA: hypothetical protein VK422_15800 [Pyrinomonadaceae bacterium]|nr:hypothetical protein [Pyrinomonadaceae bacterium]